MNRQIGILVVAGAAAVVMILLVALVAWASGGNDANSELSSPVNGSFLHPLVQREDRAGYVLAELYQDVHLDVVSNVYDGDGVLGARYWRHEEATQTCAIDLTIADQHGRNEIAPTATPRPTDTPLPTDVPLNPEVYEVVERTITTDYGAGISIALRPTIPRTQWPTATPRPTYTPYPTATPLPLLSSTAWHHWKGRPVAIDADGLAVIDVPKSARVVAHLSVRTGADSGSAREFARMPMPDPPWHGGSAYIRLPDASGRILLASDAVDAHYRSAVLHVETSPLSDCGDLRLRWQRPAAVVVKALTEQPFRDWDAADAPPPTKGPPPAERVAVYAAVGADASFNAADMKAGTHSTAAGHIVIPGPLCGISLEEGQPCPLAEQQDGYIAFAIRADLAPAGLSDIRQTGSAFNSRIAFTPASGSASVPLDIDGTDFHLYATTAAWRASLLGGEWSLTP